MYKATLSESELETLADAKFFLHCRHEWEFEQFYEWYIDKSEWGDFQSWFNNMIRCGFIKKVVDK